jgi:hypothetical protein
MVASTSAERGDLGGAGHVRWASRVQPGKIRRLYESDALGIYDEELIDEVGIGLYARCESILKVTNAHRGTIECPACRTSFRWTEDMRWVRKSDRICCPACAWETTWGDYLKTYQHKQLHAGNAEHVFTDFVRRYPFARTAQEKMRAIDGLLHEFHITSRFGYTRPAAANVIEGSVAQVMRLLDDLASESNPSSLEWRRRASASFFGRHLGERQEGD